MQETQTANWGEAVQSAYAHWMKSGQYTDWSGWKVYPSGMYDFLVQDGFIAPNAYQSVIAPARASYIGELNKKVVYRQMGVEVEQKSPKPDANVLQNLKGIILGHQAEIEKYKEGGPYEDRVILRAKQWTILTLFREARSKDVKFIYKPDDNL